MRGHTLTGGRHNRYRIFAFPIAARRSAFEIFSAAKISTLATDPGGGGSGNRKRLETRSGDELDATVAGDPLIQNANGTAPRRHLADRFSLGHRALPLRILLPQDARLAGLAWLYGDNATLGRLLGVFRLSCAWDPSNGARKPQKCGRKCGAYLMDIGRTSPPDLPQKARP